MTSMIFFSTDSRLFSKMCLFLQVKNMGEASKWVKQRGAAFPRSELTYHEVTITDFSLLHFFAARPSGRRMLTLSTLCWSNFLLFLLPTGNTKSHSNFTFLSQLSSNFQSSFHKSSTLEQVLQHPTLHSNTVTPLFDNVFIQIPFHLSR